MKKSRSRRRDKRIGILLFFLPVFLLVALVAGQELLVVFAPNGTLKVSAETSDTYYAAKELNATATVGSATEIAPFNLSLKQGTYTVLFSPLAWFETPPPRVVGLSGGRTAYVVGVYNPIPSYVLMTRAGFNTTSTRALHDFTPVIFINPASSDTILLGDFFASGRHDLFPGHPLQLVFPRSGTFEFTRVGSNQTLVVVVA